MFFGEGLSKLFFLCMVIYVSTVVYLDPDYDYVENIRNYQASEFVVIIMLVTMMIYEYGELCGSNNSVMPSFTEFGNYFGDIWNCFDFIGFFSDDTSDFKEIDILNKTGVSMLCGINDPKLSDH